MSPPPPSHHQSAKAKAATSSSSTITPPNSTTTTTSGATSSNPNMLNYLWIPFLMSLPTSSATEEAVSLVLPSEARDSFSRCPSSDPNLNFRPIIGILSHPGDGASGRLNNDTNASYIAASYVKFVESAGARVIPLIYNEPTDLLFKKLQLVNGVIFTGGWCKEGLYFDVVNSIFQYALAKNDSGDHFPLLAVCLGFELLTMIVSKDKNILEEFSASNQASTLQFTSDASIDGTLFQRFPPGLIAKLSTECLVMQNHRYGISPATFKKNKKLHNFFEILTTSTDENYQVYVSTVQALKYPVTAVQWHPEKNAFEWGSSQIPHSEDAIQVTQLVANFLVREARKSLNRPPTRKVLDNLIYNYRTTYGGKVGRGFDEVYIFSKLCSL